ncbi:MAG: sugar kinase [Candidatus Gastranaerophilales bacterium]|nr:sugar kinase [Candidatus Gastranaerophilales bacterium]
MDEKLDIITIGEGLIELSSDLSLSLAQSLDKYYGGDTLAAAVAARRLGSRVGYITRVGCDYFKEFLMDSWQAEGLDISQVKLTGDFNGLYLLARPKNGSKEFSYYRKKTAASKLSIEDISERYIENAKIFYTSGVSQSLSLSAKEAVGKAFAIAKAKGLTTAYDPNYSPLLTTIEEAKESFDDVIHEIDILFLSEKNDVAKLFEITSIEKVIKYFWDLGVNTVVIKSSQNGGYYTGYAGDIVFCEFFYTQTIDTTCSGDAFNGGFLHAVSSGFSPFEATKLASVVSGLQSQNIGAIKSIPTKEEVYREYEKI